MRILDHADARIPKVAPKAAELAAPTPSPTPALVVRDVWVGPTKAAPIATTDTLAPKRSGPDLRARFAELVLPLVERVVDLLARDRHEKRVYSVSSTGGPGNDLKIKVGQRLGKGAYGVVHALNIVSFSERFRTEHPRLFVEGKPRTDLVVKFPRRFFLPLPQSLNLFESVLLSEIDLGDVLRKRVGPDLFTGADILFASRGNNRHGLPFAIKTRLSATSVSQLARVSTDLSAEQLVSLRRDIFAPAERVYAQTGIGVDIKPENVAWDADKQRFTMYEVSPVLPGAGGFFVSSGFDSYLEQYLLALQRFAAQT